MIFIANRKAITRMCIPIIFLDLIACYVVPPNNVVQISPSIRISPQQISGSDSNLVNFVSFSSVCCRPIASRAKNAAKEPTCPT